MAAPAPEKRPSGGGNMLMQRVGPLATWVWLLIATVLIGAYYLYAKHKSASSSPTSPAGTPANASQVPDIILQNYYQDQDNPPGSVPPSPPPYHPIPGPGPIPGPPAPPPKKKTPKPPVTHKKAPPPKPGKQQYQTVTVAKWTPGNTPWNSTLSGIAEHFKVQGGYQELAKLNGIKDPNLIYPGQKIKVPA